jgi:hypothetical protein
MHCIPSFIIPMNWPGMISGQITLLSLNGLRRPWNFVTAMG